VRGLRPPYAYLSPQNRSERDEMQGARSTATEAYQFGRRGSEHRADNSASGSPDSRLRTFGATQYNQPLGCCFLAT